MRWARPPRERVAVRWARLSWASNRMRRHLRGRSDLYVICITSWVRKEPQVSKVGNLPWRRYSRTTARISASSVADPLVEQLDQVWVWSRRSNKCRGIRRAPASRHLNPLANSSTRLNSSSLTSRRRSSHSSLKLHLSALSS